MNRAKTICIRRNSSCAWPASGGGTYGSRRSERQRATAGSWTAIRVRPRRGRGMWTAAGCEIRASTVRDPCRGRTFRAARVSGGRALRLDHRLPYETPPASWLRGSELDRTDARTNSRKIELEIAHTRILHRFDQYLTGYDRRIFSALRIVRRRWFRICLFASGHITAS